MYTDPVKILDDLIKGVVLFTYDFTRLTVLGFLLPLFKNTRKIWPLMRVINKRLSSLTYLVIWILIVVTYAAGDTSEFASKIIGLEINPAVGSVFSIPTVMVTVLLITMFVDVIIRFGLLLIRNPARREFYELMARIAVANIFLGIFAVLVKASLSGCCFPLGPVMALTPFDTRVFGISFGSPYVSLFAGSLAIITIKAFEIRNWRKKIIVGLFAIVAVPTVLIYASILLFSAAYTVTARISPPNVNGGGIKQQFTRCTLSKGKIRATSALRLEGREAVAIDPHSFEIMYGDYRSMGDVGQPPIILSKSQPISVTIIAALDPHYIEKVPNPPTEIDCEIALPGGISDDSKAVEEIEIMLPPRTVPESQQ
jgi:hypothetical protein